MRENSRITSQGLLAQRLRVMASEGIFRIPLSQEGAMMERLVFCRFRNRSPMNQSQFLFGFVRYSIACLSRPWELDNRSPLGKVPSHLTGEFVCHSMFIFSVFFQGKTVRDLDIT